MKTKILLAASFIFAIGMTGCSNSMNETPEPVKEDNVLLVTLPGNATSTRAVEASVNGTGTTLTDVTVFLLNGYLVEKVVPFEQANIDAKYLRIEQVSSAVDRVMVIANKAGKDISNLKNVDEIKNFAYTVETQHLGKELENRTLMGEAHVADAVDPDTNHDNTHLYKKAEVNLEAITARIEVGTVTPGEGIADVQLLAVYINNAFGTYPQEDLIFHKEDDPCWGVDETNDLGANIGSKVPVDITGLQPYTPTEYMNAADARVKKEAGSPVYAFHVFPGNIPHIIMLVKLELLDGYYEVDDQGDALKYKYGFVTFTKFKVGNSYVAKLLPHNIYKVGVGAAGIKIDATNVTDKPEKGPYDLGVDVVIRNWSTHEVTPEV